MQTNEYMIQDKKNPFHPSEEDKDNRRSQTSQTDTHGFGVSRLLAAVTQGLVHLLSIIAHLDSKLALSYLS